MKDRYLVYATKTHRIVRVLLMLLTVFNFYLANTLSFLWLYVISFAFLIAAAIIMSFFYSYVSFSGNGIKLHLGFMKTYVLRWDEVLCCGTFSIKILGAQQSEEYVYFSKEPVTYARLIAGNTLPPQSGKFIYLANQKGIALSVQKWCPNGNAKKLIADSGTSQDFKGNRQHKLTALSFLLCLVCLASIIAYTLSQDQRWILTAVLSAFAIYKSSTVRQ